MTKQIRVEPTVQNSGGTDAESGNTIAFQATYNQYVRAVEQLLLGAKVARQTFIRLLLTLSSGSLLASISLLRYSTSADNTVWLALLAVAWSFLGISVFACLVRLGTYNHIHGYDWIVLALKDFIDEAEEFTEELNLSTKKKASSAIKIRMEQLAERPELKREDAWDSGTEIVARASFFLGLLTLIVFAIRNLPWST